MAKKIQLSTNIDNQNINVYPVTKSEFVEFPDGKTLDDKINSNYSIATSSKDGLMSKEDKIKLDNSINYIHPSIHPATMITEDSNKRFVSDVEKTKWNNKADNTMASKTNVGLMSISDKQKIDDLNNQFKSRDDKITKNTNDIASWNNEMVNKNYQYFNDKYINIDNSIVSKTQDMKICGNTMFNIAKSSVYSFGTNLPSENYTSSSGLNYCEIQIKKYVTGSWRFISAGSINFSLLKPNTLYTVFAEATDGLSVAIMTGSYLYPLTSRSTNFKNGVATFTTNDLSNGYHDQIYYISLNNDSFDKQIFKNMIVLEGDWTNKEIPGYFEGIKSFGEAEGNKISILSHNENLFDYKTMYSTDWVNGEGKIINSGDGKYYSIKVPIYEVGVKYYIYGIGKERNNIVYLDENENVIFFSRPPLNNPIELDTAPQNAKFILAYLNSKGFNQNETNELNVSLDKVNCYTPYKQDKKDILIKEPLRSVNDVKDIMYEDNSQVKVDRKLGQYTLRGDENERWLLGNTSGGWTEFDNSLIFYTLAFENKISANSVIICNRFKYSSNVSKNEISIYNNTWKNLAHPCIRIEKSKLSTPDVEGFKAWLKANPTTVVYQLATPTVEIVEDVINLNLNIFNKKTYITSNNLIKGNLSFTAPMNKAANLENNSIRLNNVEKYIDANSISKIKKLESAQMTTALNVVELQKNISMLTDYDLANYNSYKGKSFKLDNALETRTYDMKIKGMTLHNLVNMPNYVENKTLYNSNTKEYTFNCDWQRGGRSTLLKANTKYTAYMFVKSTAFKELRLEYEKEVGGTTILTSICSIGGNSDYKLFKTEFTTKNTDLPVTLTARNVGAGVINVKDFIIVENTLNFTPKYFEGIKSFGETESNKISILSNGKNLFKAYNQKVYELNFEIINNELTLNGEATQLFDYRVFHKNFNINIYDYINTLPVGTKLTLSNKIGLKNYFSVCKDGKYIYSRDSIIIGDRETDINAFIRVDPNRTFNKDEIKIQLEIGDLTSYERQKEDKKDILIKEPLRSVGDVSDELYEDNGQVKVDRRLGQYTFTGNEDIVRRIMVSETKTIGFGVKISELNNCKLGELCISDRFIYSEPDYCWNIDKECISIPDYIHFRIDKSKLVKPDIASFKAWLKTNPTTIIYQLATPTTEVIENCVDIDLDTYADRTYITSDNLIKGELEFKIPNNISAVMKNITKSISKIFKSLNNILNIKGE